jgi:hypothetical protein
VPVPADLQFVSGASTDPSMDSPGTEIESMFAPLRGTLATIEKQLREKPAQQQMAAHGTAMIPASVFAVNSLDEPQVGTTNLLCIDDSLLAKASNWLERTDSQISSLSDGTPVGDAMRGGGKLASETGPTETKLKDSLGVIGFGLDDTLTMLREALMETEVEMAVRNLESPDTGDTSASGLRRQEISPIASKTTALRSASLQHDNSKSASTDPPHAVMLTPLSWESYADELEVHSQTMPAHSR